MKILEVANGKIIAEIPGQHYTRIVCSAGSIPTGNLGITKIRESGWPIRMNTRKYHADMKARQAATTEKLRLETAGAAI